MTSEIRSNTIKNRVGLGTVSYTNTGIIVSGIVTANSFSGPISGTTGTFSGDVDINGDLDVDGHTNLDNVSIAGVTTITQDLDVDGHTNLDNVSIAGVTTITGDTGNVRLDLHATASGTGSQIKLHNDHATTYFGQAGDTTGDLLVYNESNTNIRFFTNGNNERLRIKSDGGILQTKAGSGGVNYTISRNESITSTDQVIGVLDFASNTAHTTQARVMGKTRGTSNVGGDLVFETRPDGGSLDEKVRITGDGRLGIGTQIPDTIVEIGNAIGTGTANLLKLTSYTNSQSSRPALVFWNNNPNTAQAQISAKGGASYNASKLHFSVANSSRVLQDRACIDEFGTFIIGPGETRRNTKGSNQHQVLLIEGNGNNSTRMSMIRSSNDDNGPEIQLIKTRGTSIGSVTKPNQNDYIGSLVFIGGDDTDLYSRGAEISVQATGTPANDRIPSDIIFSTTPTSGATAPQQRLRITSGGGLQFRNADTPTNNTEPALILNHAGGWQFYASSDSSTHNNIIFGTNSVSAGERLRITSAGKVSIGNESSPLGILHVKEGDSGVTSAGVHQDTVFIENSANAGITIATPNTNTGYLTFADPEDDNVGMIIYRHGGTNANSMGFFVNAEERLRIDSDGNIGAGGITSPLWTSGGGIHLNDNYGIGFGNGGSGRPDFQLMVTDGSTLQFRCGFGADTADINMDTSGRLLIGTTTPSISSSELFEVKSSATGFSHFRNNSSSYATIYIDNEYSDTGFAPFLTFTDGGGNRGGIGQDQNDLLRITGQGGVSFYTAGTHGGGTEKLRIHQDGGLQIGSIVNVSAFSPNTSGITGGLVLTTPVYSEYHYTWSGHSSYTIDLTCASYFSSEFIYVQHQTNGGSRMQQYARGKWSNNHYQHTLNVWEWSGSGGGLSVSFTASDQSGGGSINGLSNMSNNGSTYSGFTNGGGESNSTTANGRFRISETYNWGSVSSRALIVRCYYGSFAISKS